MRIEYPPQVENKEWYSIVNSQKQMENIKDNSVDLAELDVSNKSAREMLVDNYYTETAPIRECIRRIMADNDCGPLEAGFALIQSLKRDKKIDREYAIELTQAVTYELYSEKALDIEPVDLGLELGNPPAAE